MRKNPKHSVQMIFRKRIDFIIFLALCLFITKPSKGDLTKEVDNQLGEMGDIGVLPEQKKKRLMNFIIGDKDRNPFVVPKKETAVVQGVNSHSEETKIRTILESLKVNGISKGKDGYKVQLGGIILSQGRVLPRIMDGQSDDLIVKEISSKKIEIVWAGDEEADKPRVMSISFDLEPRVGVVLPVDPKPKSENSKLVYTDKKERVVYDDN